MARKLITNEEIDNEIKNVEEAIANNPVDVSNLKEVSGPTFKQQIAKLDEQIADQTTYPMVRDALVRARAQIVRGEMRSLMEQIRVVRAMLPARVARVKK